MIRLFDSKETNFKHCNWVLSEAISCFVTEAVEGIFDLDLVYPLEDKKNLSQFLINGNIIKSPISETDSRGEQLFTIRKRNPNTKEKTITIYAQAKARRDLDLNMVLGLEVPAGITRKGACQMMLTKCVDAHQYFIGNLDTNPNTSINLGLEEATGNVIKYLDISGISPRKGFLSEDENSIYKAYGGEIIFNNYEINMVDERGSDHSFEIRSLKNLEELQQDIDDTDTESFATAVLPCSSDGVYLPNSEVIYSPNVAIVGKRFKKVVFDDVSLVDNTQEALDIVYAQLRERTQKLFDNGLDKLKINNTINFVQLSSTEEYKDYKMLEKCELGNNVVVKYFRRDNESQVPYIEATGRVVKIKFNVLKNKIEEVEIGDRKKASIATQINSVQSTATKAATTAVETKTNLSKAKKDIQVKIETLQGQINLSVTEEELWALIQLNPGKILMAVNDEDNETDVTITPGEGLAVKNGKISIYNSSGQLMLQGNTKGSLSVRNGFLVTNFAGQISVEIGADGIIFYKDNYSMRGIKVNDDGDLEIKGPAHFDNEVDVFDLRINGTHIDDYIKGVVGTP
jgi:phage-related protein